jgi:hypothetical protein
MEVAVSVPSLALQPLSPKCSWQPGRAGVGERAIADSIFKIQEKSKSGIRKTGTRDKRRKVSVARCQKDRHTAIGD